MRYNMDHGGDSMEKTATLSLRVSPGVKEDAESILKKLGIPMSVAIDMYLKQIVYAGGIPFRVTLPQAPDSINMDLMSNGELHSAIAEGYTEYKAGKAVDIDNLAGLRKVRLPGNSIKCPSSDRTK